MRVDRFTGASSADARELVPAYAKKCFLVVDGTLTRLPTTPWAKEARYTPGQVYCPRAVDRDDVNPRPLSSLVPSSSLCGCFSADERMIPGGCLGAIPGNLSRRRGLYPLRLPLRWARARGDEADSRQAVHRAGGRAQADGAAQNGFSAAVRRRLMPAASGASGCNRRIVLISEKSPFGRNVDGFSHCWGRSAARRSCSNSAGTLARCSRVIDATSFGAARWAVQNQSPARPDSDSYWGAQGSLLTAM